ncbi:hypothetical protein OFO01_03400 [Campylobacter sp. JMF_01 NE2]|uniref:hypothetical protein n=1 Tax=unclassified Campylobacter TaxID=2593542 RepID=UPI0022E9EE66|nr:MULTISPECIES: hypothetical protein [unclassified Campylobacter]MDA3052489.1 hypothetical protein [Campylobacter sp. JMF_03 NE3]MDA3066822.1 hypothetical protein [Campylobacter sp. JMF_01 NE2]
MRHYYYKKSHQNLPHIVKFSGGRSSGYMLFNMLKNGMLKKERGDFVLFNNTSAEHSKTYEFVMKCKRECEEKYGIPFFLIEFQTFEDCKGGIYDRFGAYRLVNDKPFSKKNPFGYKFGGEVFEELISWKAFVPNQMSRICTQNLKMETSKQFIRDWFFGESSIPRLGHFDSVSLIDKDTLYEKHLKNKGSVPRKIYLAKKEFVLNLPLWREEQEYQDFTSVDLGYRKEIKGSEYLTFIGFRSDEPQRITKMKDRIAKNDKKSAEYNDNINLEEFPYLRDGVEHVYMPMIKFCTTKQDVKEFWEKQNFDLGLDYDGKYGNCVYCFMKGTKKLLEIKSASKLKTPENIDWWIKMEQKYQRDLKAEGRKTKKDGAKFVNFFGESSKLSYEKIKNGSDEIEGAMELPCHCSD